jgi:hypothetical protein
MSHVSRIRHHGCLFISCTLNGERNRIRISVAGRSLNESHFVRLQFEKPHVRPWSTHIRGLDLIAVFSGN